MEILGTPARLPLGEMPTHPSRRAGFSPRAARPGPRAARIIAGLALAAAGLPGAPSPAPAAANGPAPAAAAGAPAPGSPWTLERVLDEARAKDPGIAAARHAGEAGRADGAAALSALSPRVSLDAGFTRSDDPALLFSQKLWEGRFMASDFALPALNQPAPRNAWNWGVTLEQPLWNGGAEVTAPAAASHRRAAATAGQRASVADRLLAAAGTFAGAVRARDALAADSVALAAAEEQRRAAVERFRKGQVPELDTLRAVTHWAESRTAWLTARKDLDVALRRLSLLVGADVAAADLAALPEAEAVAPAEPSADRRGELAAAREQARALRIESTRAALSLLPSVNVRLDLRDYRDPDTGEGERRFLVGVSASLPVWDGLARIERRRAAKARAEEAEALAEQLRRDLGVEVLDARGEASLSIDRRDAARMARASSDEALRLATARYSAGLLSQTDLLAADAEAARARLAAVDAEVDAVLAQYRYRHATGALE